MKTIIVKEKPDRAIKSKDEDFDWDKEVRV